MTEREKEKLLNKLQKVITVHGYAYVATKFGHRDTGAIKKWFRCGLPHYKLEWIKSVTQEIYNGL